MIGWTMGRTHVAARVVWRDHVMQMVRVWHRIIDATVHRVRRVREKFPVVILGPP